MKFEEFIHMVAQQINGYLTEGLKGLEVAVVCVKRGGFLKEAKLYLERDNKRIGGVNLQVFYQIFQRGIHWQLLMRNIAGEMERIIEGKEGVTMKNEETEGIWKKIVPAVCVLGLGVIIIKRMRKKRNEE